MQCYRHEERHAVAVCRNCGKAACPDCCEDTGQGIACCWTCEEELRESYRVKDRLKQSFGIGSRLPTPVSVSMYAFFGVILLAVGVYLSYTRPEVDYLTLAMSAVFFVMAAASYKRFRDTCLTC